MSSNKIRIEYFRAMNFRLDFSRLDRLELKALGILPQDLSTLFITENTEFHERSEFSYAIGYINQTRFIHAAYLVSKSDNFDLELLQVGVPDEEDIKAYWCKRKGC